MKLVKPKVAEPQNPKEEKINPKQIRQSYLDRIESELEGHGAVFFDEKKLNISVGHLELPREITEVPNKELGEYLNAFTQQKMYLRTLLGRVSLVLEDKKRAYMEVSKEVYRKYSLDSKLSETAKDRIINSNEEVNPIYCEYADYQKKHNIVELSIFNIEDAIFMISREITRRTGDFNEENRNHNVGRR